METMIVKLNTTQVTPVTVHRDWGSNAGYVTLLTISGNTYMVHHYTGYKNITKGSVAHINHIAIYMYVAKSSGIDMINIDDYIRDTMLSIDGNDSEQGMY